MTALCVTMATSDASSIVLTISARKPDAGSWCAIIEIGLDPHATLFSFFPSSERDYHQIADRF